jgi:hypothetical protein
MVSPMKDHVFISSKHRLFALTHHGLGFYWQVKHSYFCWGLHPYDFVYIGARVSLRFFLDPSIFI